MSNIHIFIKEGEELEQKASPGPWVEDDGFIHSEPLEDLCNRYIIAKLDGDPLPCKERPQHLVAECSQELTNSLNDADFIVWARNNISYLLSVAKAAQEWYDDDAESTIADGLLDASSLLNNILAGKGPPSEKK